MASIKRNFLYNILRNLSNVIFPLITAPYVARVLDPDGIGLFNFANTYANYFAMFAAIGSYTYSTREISKRRDSQEEQQTFVSQIISVTAINTVLVSLIFVASLFLIPQLSEDKIIFLIAGFTIYFVPLQIDWYYSGLERFDFITKRALLIRVISIICLFLFVKSRADLYIYMFLGVAGSFGGIVWNFIAMMKDGIKIKLTTKGISKHYKPMLLLFSSSVAISIYTMLDTIMLGFMSDYAETGYYNSATHLARTLLAVVTSLSSVAVPRVSYYLKNKQFSELNDLISKSLGIVSFLAIPMTIGLACMAPTFIPLFLGDKFYGAIIPLIIMSGVITAIGFNNLTGVQILIGMGMDKRFLYCVLWGTVSNFILNLVLIPHWGASGAAAASVFAEFLILVVTYLDVKRFTNIKFGKGKHDIWKSLLASLTFIPIAILYNRILSGWANIACLIFTCVAVYYLLQKILKCSSMSFLEPMIKKLLHLK